MNPPLPLRARRVHIAGSASANAKVGRARLDAAHEIVRLGTWQLLEAGATFVSSVGREARSADGVPLVFYWTTLEQVARWVREHREEARARAPVLKVVTTEKALAAIPGDRSATWTELLESGVVAVESLPPGWRSASLVRTRQVRYGNVLIAVSGAVGVQHLAELYGERGNPVIPLPFDLGSSRDEEADGGFALFRQARADATRFFTIAGEEATARLLTLDPALDPQAFAGRLVDLVRALAPPRAFCIRSMNPKEPEFAEVERLFQTVVGPALKDLGYDMFDLTVDKPESLFLNAEIFAQLHRSALAVCELTGLRNNVFMEGGYALGRQMPTVLVARHGVQLPFDASELSCHKWSPEEAADNAVERFRSDVRAALVRKPLIS